MSNLCIKNSKLCPMWIPRCDGACAMQCVHKNWKLDEDIIWCEVDGEDKKTLLNSYNRYLDENGLYLRNENYLLTYARGSLLSDDSVLIWNPVLMKFCKLTREEWNIILMWLFANGILDWTESGQPNLVKSIKRDTKLYIGVKE